VEIDLGGDEMGIQSLEDKQKKPKGKVCPAIVNENIASELRRLTKETFRVLGIYDFSRVDFRMDKDNNLYILELNSMASLGSTGSYVLSAKTAGYTFDTMINRMLDVAVERYFGSQDMEQVAFEESTAKSKSLPLTVRLRSYLRGNVATMEEDLAKMVEINSYVRNIEGVNSFGRWISNKLSELGFQRLVIPRAELGNNLYLTNHLNDTNDVLLVGNLDNPIHFQDFSSFMEERGRIYGTGVSRGKGGLAVMLGALKALRFTRSLKKVRCGIVLITDESLGGGSSRQLIEDISNKSKYVFGLRGAGLAGELITSCSGSLRFNIEISYYPGKTRSKIDTKQIDPVSFVAEKVLALQKVGMKEDVSVIVTSIQTKMGEDMPPDHASLGVLIRYSNPRQRDDLEKQIYDIFKVESNRPIKVHITKGPPKQPLLESESDSHLYDLIENLAKKLEVRVKKAHSEISSSLSYVPNEIAALDGFGPVTGGFGTSNEYVVRDSLIDRAVLLAYVIFKTSKNFSS
jgi:D-alanine-D-alanine ligase